MFETAMNKRTRDAFRAAHAERAAAWSRLAARLNPLR